MTRYDALLIGRTPVAAILARRLAAAGRSIAVIGDGLAHSFTGLIRWLTLRDLGIGDHAVIHGWPVVDSFVERLLLEDGSLDAIYRSERLADQASRFLATDSVRLTGLVIDEAAAVDSGTAVPVSFLWDRGRVTGARFADGSEIEARLTIVTSDNRLILGATDSSLPVTIAPPFFEQIEIGWMRDSDGSAQRTHLAGGPLAAAGASAILMTSPGRAVLSLIAPAEELVREGIVVTDVIGGLLRHAALGDLPPLDSATSARIRFLTLPAKVALDRYGAGYAVLGAMAGLSEPGSFDREITLASEIASRLVAADVEKLGEVALFGAIAGEVGDLSCAKRDLGSQASQANADWILSHPDLLGPALARLARNTSSDA